MSAIGENKRAFSGLLAQISGRRMRSPRRTQSARMRMHEYVERWHSFTKREQLRRFRELPLAQRAEALIQLAVVQQESIIERLSPTALKAIVQQCDPDDLVDIIQNIRTDLRTRLWTALPAKRQEETRALLKYAQNDAAGVMTSRYVAVQSDLTVRAAINYLRTVGRQAETIYYIYVIDEQGVLQGVVSLRDLLTAENAQRIAAIMETDVVSVFSDTDQEDAAKMLSDYDLIALPVCDHDGSMLGIITFDDVIDVLRAATIYKGGKNPLQFLQ